MSSSAITASPPRAVYQDPPPASPTAQTAAPGAGVVRGNQALIADARLALANAYSIVDADKRNHSPACVACDEKLIDRARVQLAQAEAAPASPGAFLNVNL
jgi:hypothetical protein